MCAVTGTENATLSGRGGLNRFAQPGALEPGCGSPFWTAIIPPALGSCSDLREHILAERCIRALLRATPEENDDARSPVVLFLYLQRHGAIASKGGKDYVKGGYTVFEQVLQAIAVKNWRHLSFVSARCHRRSERGGDQPC